MRVTTSTFLQKPNILRLNLRTLESVAYLQLTQRVVVAPVVVYIEFGIFNVFFFGSRAGLCCRLINALGRIRRVDR